MKSDTEVLVSIVIVILMIGILAALLTLIDNKEPTPCIEYGTEGGLECVTLSDGTTLCYSKERLDEKTDSNTSGTAGS